MGKKAFTNAAIVLEVDCDCDEGYRPDPLAYTEEQKRSGSTVQCADCDGTHRIRVTIPLLEFVTIVRQEKDDRKGLTIEALVKRSRRARLRTT